MKISEIINEYINTNDKINNMNNKMKELKDYNKKLSDGIIHFMEKNNKNDLSYNNTQFELKKILPLSKPYYQLWHKFLLHQ